MTTRRHAAGRYAPGSPRAPRCSRPARRTPQVAQFYAPSLSALQLFAAAPPAAASGDASVPRLVFEYFERAPPFARKPLSDALADLAGGGSGGAELGTLSSADLHARSFVSVCWQPISRIPLGRAFRELTASFVTYHSLAPGAAWRPHLPRVRRPWLTSGRLAGGANLPPSCSPTVRQALAERLAEQGTGTATLLPAFGLLGLKMNADQWLEGGDPRLRTELDTACAQWMAPLAGRHSDYEFYRASQGAH